MTPTNHNFLIVFCLMRNESVVSYSWVLRDIFGSALSPNVMVTERDEGLSVGICDVFPGKKVILINYCSSISNDIENMVDKLCGRKRNQQGQIFRQTRWNPLVNCSMPN